MELVSLAMVVLISLLWECWVGVYFLEFFFFGVESISFRRWVGSFLFLDEIAKSVNILISMNAEFWRFES